MEAFKKVYYLSGALTPTKDNPNLDENQKRMRHKALELMQLGFGVIIPTWLGEEIGEIEGANGVDIAQDKERRQKWEELIVEGNDFACQAHSNGSYFLSSARDSSGGLKEIGQATRLKADDPEYDIIFEGADNDPTS